MLVIGERAVRPFIGGDGSSRVKNPPVVREPLAELKRCLGKGAEVEFLDEGCRKTYENEIGYMENALYEKASKADAVVVFLGQDYSQSSETMDRNHMEIEPYQEHVLRVCRRASQRVIAVLNIGSAVTVSHWEKYADAILVSWMGGQGMGAAVARALTGAINPAGRLAETFPKRQQDVLSLQTYPGDGLKIEYREGLMVGYRHFDTNFKTIRSRIERLKAIETMAEDGTFDVLPKKEVIKIKKEWEKLEKNLGGIKEMPRIPDAIFVVDPKKERICVQEAHALGITLIGIGDTNCDPEELDYIIPGNDDAIRAVKLITSKMADAVIEANQGEEVYTEEAVAAAEGEASDIEEVAAAEEA